MLGYDQSQLGGLAQLAGEPRPLRRTQHGLGRIGIGQVAFLAAARRAWSVSLSGERNQRTSSRMTCTAHAGRADDVRIVDAFARAPDVGRRDLPELEERAPSTHAL